MVDQSKVGIARPAVDGALVLEYEDVLTGKSSKLSRSRCLRLCCEYISFGSTAARWQGSTNPFDWWS